MSLVPPAWLQIVPLLYLTSGQPPVVLEEVTLWHNRPLETCIMAKAGRRKDIEWWQCITKDGKRISFRRGGYNTT